MLRCQEKDLFEVLLMFMYKLLVSSRLFHLNELININNNQRTTYNQSDQCACRRGNKINGPGVWLSFMITCSAIMERSQFFRSKLSQIENARDFEKLLDRCLQIQDEIEDENYDSLEAHSCHPKLPIDKEAAQFYPPDAPRGFVPRRVQADGNCLYNSVSVLLCGDEHLSTELRVKATIDLVIHRDTYVNLPFISRSTIAKLGGMKFGYKKQVENVALQLVSFEAFDSHEPGNFRKTYEHLVLNSSGNHKYACLFHVAALSNVTGYSINSIYPNKNARIRPLMNVQMYPDCPLAAKSTMLNIMWTGQVESETYYLSSS